ncbi:ABC transporter substrate-binding protein [Polynucleobacter sp. 30F-ANTBAC]|nr:ABC transporter substrate-binding protein [Polynucleobacter sp. 30F-ANTBAC]
MPLLNFISNKKYEGHMISRRNFILFTTLAGITNAVSAAQKNKKILIITYRGDTQVEQGFKDYFEKNKLPVQFETRDLGRDVNKMADIISEIKQIKPDLILAWGTSTTIALVGTFNNITSTHINDIPVVFALVSSPVESKIVSNTSNHGRKNLTGVSHMASLRSQISAIKAYKDFKKLGFLYTSTEQNSISTLNELKTLAKEFKFQLIDYSFNLDNGKPTSDGYEQLILKMKLNGAEWLYLPPDSFLGTQAKEKIIPFAHQEKIATFASTEQLMDAGALTGLFSKYYNVGDYAGFKAGKILYENIRASDINIDTLSKFSYNVNMDTAKSLNRIPPLSLFNFITIHSSS